MESINIVDSQNCFEPVFEPVSIKGKLGDLAQYVSGDAEGYLYSGYALFEMKEGRRTVRIFWCVVKSVMSGVMWKGRMEVDLPKMEYKEFVLSNPRSFPYCNTRSIINKMIKDVMVGVCDDINKKPTFIRC